jgi:hypothetical protein
MISNPFHHEKFHRKRKKFHHCVVQEIHVKSRISGNDTIFTCALLDFAKLYLLSHAAACRPPFRHFSPAFIIHYRNGKTGGRKHQQ